MPATRAKNKRAASPAADEAEVAAAAKPRAAKKAKVTKGETGSDVSDNASKSKTARGKAKSKAQPLDADNSNGDATLANASKARSKGKAKTKVEPEDDVAMKAEDGQDGAAAIDSGPGDSAQEISDAQYAKTKNLNFFVDEHAQMPSYSVYVDPDTAIIYDAALNQTNAGNNHNKFYKIQLLTNGTSYRTWTRWGRVGERGQNLLLGNGSLHDALANFDKKFREKTGLTWKDRGSKPKSGKYVFLEKSYEEDSDEEEKPVKSKSTSAASRSSPPKCTLQPPVKSLMEMIFNEQYFEQAMQDLNYDVAKLPLGKLSKATISRGYQTLKDLAALFNDPSLAASIHETDYNTAVEQLSNQYYSYIPHDFGRNRPPVIRFHESLKREIDLMDSLTDLKDADQIIKMEKSDIDPIHPLDSRYKALGMQEMTPVDSKSQEFAEISQYLVKTCGSTHSMDYQVRDVFRIERQGETLRFEESNFAKIKSDRRLLWHGSRATNFGGILSQGLRIAPPEAPVSGYMFGKGIYLADMSSKSANYCCPGISGGEALLLLCEAELGQPMQTLKHSSYSAGEDALQGGMYSTWGQGRTGPHAWKDASCVHPSLAGVVMPDTTQAPGQTGLTGTSLVYNEYIAYDVAQVRLRYLLRVKV